MKISELVKTLEAIRTGFGDLHIRVLDYGVVLPLQCISLRKVVEIDKEKKTKAIYNCVAFVADDSYFKEKIDHAKIFTKE